MSVSLSNRIQKVKPSATIAVTARAAEMRAAGHDVISLGIGEPDFDTPDHIKEAAMQAIRDGFTKYTAVDGIVELKDAIADKFRRDNKLDYARNQILVSSGAKQTFYNLCQAYLDPGDQAIIPTPAWVSYPDMVMLADGVPVEVFAGPGQGYKINAGQLAEAITDKTRLLVLNSPCNPSGAAFTLAELEALGEVLEKHPQIVIATDDMYEHIYWADEPFTSFAQACPNLYDRTLTINGVSKCYSMTGWRIGYAGGPIELIAAMKKIQGQSTSNPASISQKAAVAALAGDQNCIGEMTNEFRRRHDIVVTTLNEIPGINCLAAAGTFYAFADVNGAIEMTDSVEDDSQFCEFLIENAGVAVVPGSAFGAPGHFRLSFAASMDVLRDALNRIGNTLND